MDISRSFIIAEEDQSKRLDVYLASTVAGVTRSGVKNLVEKGKVLVNGGRVKAGYALRTGDCVTALIPVEKPAAISPEAIALKILYEDDDIIVIDKPSGLSVHPGAGRASGTLVNALLNHTKDLSTIAPDRPGIVHRLDMDTTGVLVVAKNNASHENLSAQFKAHAASRRYRALVWGALKEDGGIIDMPIGRAVTHRKRMSTRARKSRRAITRWRAIKRYPGITLVELMPETGRTHQLRVHLAAINHPVVGDQVYAGKGIASSLPARAAGRIKGVKRQLLHAGVLGIKHPSTGEYMEFSSPLPADMDEIIRLLDETCSHGVKETA